MDTISNGEEDGYYDFSRFARITIALFKNAVMTPILEANAKERGVFFYAFEAACLRI